MATAATEAPAANMVWIFSGGSSLMGSDDLYPEERPAHRVAVDGFWMDRHTVTNAEFRRFVGATGYVTVAERPLDPTTIPAPSPSARARLTRLPQGGRARRPRRLRNWWIVRPRRVLERPGGAGQLVQGPDSHPVVHVAWEDARPTPRGPGKELPTEAEWEFAARGGLDGATFAWGDETSRTAIRWRTPGRASSPGRT